MIIFKMVVQIFFELKHSSAQRAAVEFCVIGICQHHDRLVLVVGLLVFAAVSLLSESTTANPTGIWALIRVCANVGIQGVTAAETTTTVSALVWPFFRVDNLKIKIIYTFKYHVSCTDEKISVRIKT